MCGIAGWLGKVDNREEVANCMLYRMRHRGPDAQGIQHWDDATLIHARLSIIDLSPTGAQPMTNEDGNIWTVFNGEIYNHHGVRRGLEARGHVFRGRSDTEIIPHLFEEKGSDFINDLEGMFTIAVFDVRNRSMYLARDRFGIKPLFFAEVDGRIAFASEIRSLLEMPGIDRRVNQQALADFTSLSFIPAPDTFFMGIHALQPGEMLEAHLPNGRLEWRVRTYHQWHATPDPSMTMEQAIQHTDELLASSVARQIESDVPLGALLSGGIDSSLVSAAAQQAVDGSLRTFNVKFPDERFDETWAAKAVAERIQSQHTTLGMDDIKGSWEHVTGLLEQAGQPFADTSLFPTHAVSGLMRQHVTVALSGDGGDEAFGGYITYKRATQLAGLQNIPRPIRRLGWLAAGTMSSPLVSLGKMDASLPHVLREMQVADDAAAIAQTFASWVKAEEQKRLLQNPNVLPVRRHFESSWANQMPAKVSWAERLFTHVTEVHTRLIMPNAFLFKVDIASMKESLEVRVPILDENLFAFALTVPHHLKVRQQQTKAVLREIAARKLPDNVANKPKQGFEIPVDSWVSTEFKTQLRETLLSPSSRLDEFYRPQEYRPIIEAFCEGRAHQGVNRIGTYRRAMMFLAVHLALAQTV